MPETPSSPKGRKSYFVGTLLPLHVGAADFYQGRPLPPLGKGEIDWLEGGLLHPSTPP